MMGTLSDLSPLSLCHPSTCGSYPGVQGPSRGILNRGGQSCDIIYNICGDCGTNVHFSCEKIPLLSTMFNSTNASTQVKDQSEFPEFCFWSEPYHLLT